MTRQKKDNDPQTEAEESQYIQTAFNRIIVLIALESSDPSVKICYWPKALTQVQIKHYKTKLSKLQNKLTHRSLLRQQLPVKHPAD